MIKVALKSIVGGIVRSPLLWSVLSFTALGVAVFCECMK